MRNSESTYHKNSWDWIIEDGSSSDAAKLLNEYDEGGRSETIILHRLYSPNRI